MGLQDHAQRTPERAWPLGRKQDEEGRELLVTPVQLSALCQSPGCPGKSWRVPGAATLRAAPLWPGSCLLYQNWEFIEVSALKKAWPREQTACTEVLSPFVHSYCRAMCLLSYSLIDYFLVIKYPPNLPLKLCRGKWAETGSGVVCWWHPCTFLSFMILTNTYCSVPKGHWHSESHSQRKQQFSAFLLLLKLM